MRGQTHVFLSQNGQFRADSSFAENNKNFTFLDYVRLAKIREIQCAVFEKKNAENLQFLEFLTILAQILDRHGPKCPIFEFS